MTTVCSITQYSFKHTTATLKQRSAPH